MDKKKKTSLLLALFAALWFVLGGLCGFFAAKGIYDQPLQESVTRDTTTTIDTIPDIAPEPKDSTPVRTIIRWLPMKLPKKSGADKESVGNPYPASTDTISQWQYFGITEHPQDSAMVEIPITSKHYSSEQYDAWISGYEASLDSIKVYQKETVITETITKVVNKKKHFFLDVGGGCEHSPNEKITSPFAELGLNYKKDKLGIGVYGGYQHTINENKAEPYIRAKITYDIISF